MRDVAGDDNVIRFLDDLSFRMALAVRNLLVSRKQTPLTLSVR